VVSKNHSTVKFPDHPHTRLHAGGVTHDVAQTDDLRDSLRLDIVKNGRQRLEIRVDVTDDSNGGLHGHEYDSGAKPSTGPEE